MVEKVRLNIQTGTGCWHKSVEGFEGIASSFWQQCVPSRREAGAAGGRWIQSSHGLESSGSWCREGLSPGSAPSSLPGLPWENSLIDFLFLTLLILCLKSFVGVFLSDG